MIARWSLARRISMIALIAVSCSDAGESSSPTTITAQEGATLGTASTPAPTTRAPESPGATIAPAAAFTRYPVPPGSHPHDVAPAPDGKVWYTAQGSGELGRLDPAT